MLYLLIITVLGIFLAAYLLYGRFLSGRLRLDNTCLTPACKINDGVDYIPAKPALLLGQHFSAIAAAGPIVGPILACLWFGWLPAVLWILLGAIFIGGVHDFFSLIASVRHKACSIGEIIKEYLPGRSRIFFLVFVWLALIYVIIAFTDITAQTFKTTLEGFNFGNAVAASSLLYLVTAIIMGILLYKFKLKLGLATLIFLPITLFIVWVGPHLPSTILVAMGNISIKGWDIILLLYCFVASLIPLWLLLQPRGYLGGWFLYLVIFIGLIGALFGGFKIEYPALNIMGLESLANQKSIFPLLFITIACGAVSGFHGIVSSGTTSKQIKKEGDTLIVGYGAMLLEGLVAVLAISTVIILPKGSEILKTDPNLIYAHGIARYLSLVKVGYKIALPFALLAFSTFVYDTLDVCTRLARYILQELTGWRSRWGGIMAALISLSIPFIFLMFTEEKAYLVAWPIFGTSNQLLASLTLLAISLWLIKCGKKPFYTIIPMLFMLVVTIWSLLGLIAPFVSSICSWQKGKVSPDAIMSGVCGIILLALTFILVWETIRVLLKNRSKHLNQKEQQNA
jgi:carbon starvation protein